MGLHMEISVCQSYSDFCYQISPVCPTEHCLHSFCVYIACIYPHPAHHVPPAALQSTVFFSLQAEKEAQILLAKYCNQPVIIDTVPADSLSVSDPHSLLAQQYLRRCKQREGIAGHISCWMLVSFAVT